MWTACWWYKKHEQKDFGTDGEYVNGNEDGWTHLKPYPFIVNAVLNVCYSSKANMLGLSKGSERVTFE